MSTVVFGDNNLPDQTNPAGLLVWKRMNPTAHLSYQKIVLHREQRQKLLCPIIIIMLNINSQRKGT
jgi:hypothetical protein